MRKNPCPPSVREFPEEPEERSHGDGASSPSTWKPRGIVAWLLSPSFCPSAASPRFCPEGGSLQVTPSRRNRCPQADDWDPCRTKPRGGTALGQYTRLVRCPHPPGSPSTIRSWGRLLTPSVHTVSACSGQRGPPSLREGCFALMEPVCGKGGNRKKVASIEQTILGRGARGKQLEEPLGQDLRRS